jgi:transcriptional regulator with PAS, ATPase and Fis domain
LHLPALRDRKGDIPELVGFFMRNHNLKMGMNVRDISGRAMDAILAYRWPGNIRELSNAIERAMLFSNGELLDLPDLPVFENTPSVQTM